MAIFTPGAAIAAASGSVGGTTFSHNRGGPYIRRRAIPVNPQTPRQLAIRSFITYASQGWRTMTSNDQVAWQTWAQLHPITNALGNSITLTGHQAFVQLNARLLHDTQPPITTPPLDAPPVGLLTLAFTADIGLGAVAASWTPTPMIANERVIFYCAVVDSEGINNVNSLYKYLARSAVEAASPMDLQAQIELAWGTLGVGQVIFLRAHTFGTTTGLISGPLIVRAATFETA